VDELARDGQYKKQQSPVIPEEYEALHFCTSVQMEAAGIEPASRDVSA